MFHSMVSNQLAMESKQQRLTEHDKSCYVTDEMSYYEKKFNCFLNQVDLMPLYNRSHSQSKSRGEGDIALHTYKKQVFLEKQIKSDDTLQSVALEFNVSVAELKRINHIHKDNEIYARKVLKVPSNPLSLLLEREYFKDNEKSEANLLVPESCNVIVETVNNSNCIPKNSCDNSTETEQGKLSYLLQPGDEVKESVSLLTTTVKHKTTDVMSCNGADWGISWHALILVTLVLGVGGPVLYVFWFLWGRKGKAEGS